MIDLTQLTKTWESNSMGFRIAPSGLSWITPGSYIKVGDDCLIFDLEGVRIGDAVKIGDYCTIGKGCILDDGCNLGTMCYLEANCRLGLRTRLGPKVLVKRGAEIGTYCNIERECSIGRETKIQSSCTVRQRSYIGAKCLLEPSCQIGPYCRIVDGCRLEHLSILGSHCALEEGCVIPTGCTLGDETTLGCRATNPVDLGHTDGYRKTFAEVDGVAYIGAGCRWFTLKDALKHWSEHEENRKNTLCLMQAAMAFAQLRGLRLE